MRDFLGERLVGEQAPGEPVDRAGMTAVRLGKCVLAVPGDRDHERGIAQVAQRLGVHVEPYESDPLFG